MTTFQSPNDPQAAAGHDQQPVPYVGGVKIPQAVGNGGVQQLTPAQLATQYGAGNVKTPSKDFAFPWQSQLIQFRNGVPAVITDPALLAALTAAAAPLV